MLENTSRMKQEELAEKYSKMSRKVLYYRGSIIHLMVDVENYLDEIISDHYCGHNVDLQMEFFHVVLGKREVMLGFKIDVFAFILKNHYRPFMESHPTLLEDLYKMMEVRNKFAHRRFFAERFLDQESDEWVLDTFTTKSNKKKKTTTLDTDPFPISKKIVSDYVLKIKKIINELGEFPLKQWVDEE